MKNGMRKRGGFTVIELIVVLAIIAILVAIAIPIYNNVLNDSKIRADNHSVMVLNQASVAYALTEEIESSDVFDGISSDSARLQKLVDEKYLEKGVAAQQEGASFCWIVDEQIWVIQGGAAESGGGSGGEATPAPTSSGDDLSGYDAWSSDAIYDTANNYVVYDGKLYYNLWWIDGNTPPGSGQVWQQVTDQWVYYNIYNNGDTTEYEGQTYKARFWTSGQTPEHSEYGPWELMSE